MKIIWSICLILMINMTAKAQHNNLLLNTISIDSLLAHTDFDFGVATEFEIPETDKQFSTLLEDYKIIVFLGTWCSDSQELMPEIYYFFKKYVSKQEDIVYYGLDETKLSTDKWEASYDIAFVPTIVFVNKTSGTEKGRIVERFQKDIYTDIYEIIKH